MKIDTNAVVTIDFEMTNNDGEVIDSTKNDALVYLHGHQNIMPELEDKLNGLEAGSDFSIALPPEEAFGEKNDERIFSVAKSEFDANDLEVGMQFQTLDADENPVIATILEIKEEEVVIDENHPLAGMTLTFKGKVLDIREATEEEMSHGHIHAAGGGCGHDHGHDEQEHVHGEHCNH